MRDRVHMYVKIPPELSISSFMGYQKGKSTLLIFERHAELKHKYGSRYYFWYRVYYVSTVGKKAVQEYVNNQEREYMLYEQISIEEYMDPFNPEKPTTSSRNNGFSKCRS